MQVHNSRKTENPVLYKLDFFTVSEVQWELSCSAALGRFFFPFFWENERPLSAFSENLPFYLLRSYRGCQIYEFLTIVPFAFDTDVQLSLG